MAMEMESGIRRGEATATTMMERGIKTDEASIAIFIH